MFYIDMIQRPAITQVLKTALDRSRVVALLGPRQCGKTTLARQFVSPESPHYISSLYKRKIFVVMSLNKRQSPNHENDSFTTGR